ncbi:hypothetical protein V498_07366 [Pseudogymnoascus sp. VKM F-4517 (FW-2822)]|nr:hypothetical protein V498_07366 [Pseudogymnoascus sp. VKM F-4517 (FW-2822)]
MSQRPAASRPVSQPAADGLNDRPPADAFRGQEGQHAGLNHGDQISRERNLQQLSHQPSAQSPAQPYSPMTPGDTRTSAGASRGVGVHTMLNPTESGTSGVYSTFASNAQMGSADRSLPQQTTGPEIPTLAPRLNHPLNSHGLFSTNAAFSGPRRRSLAPNVHRSVSLGNTAMGPQRPSAQPQSENDRGRPHIVVPGSDSSSEIPPVPAIPAHIRAPFNLPPPVSGPPLNRRASVAVMGGPTARLPNSQSASPNSPYSYNSHPSPVPITQMNQPPAGPSYFTGSTPRVAFPEGDSSQGGQQEPVSYTTHLSARIPVQGDSRGDHSLLLSTEMGEFVVPLDVAVGSTEAANRRKRNADASARFRDRNKEKKQRENKEISDRDKLIDYHKERSNYHEERSNFFERDRDELWAILYDNPATRSQALQRPLQRPTVQEPSPPSHGLPSGPRLQSPGGDMGQSERASKRRRLHDQGEFMHPNNQPGPEEEHQMQYAPPTTPYLPPTGPYAPALSQQEEGQHPQYIPPHTRRISGPGPRTIWSSNTAAQRPPPVFYPQGGGDRSWPSGQLPQPPQTSQQSQQLPQQQSQYQAQHQAQYQAQHQEQQQAQRPTSQSGDTSRQRQ